MNLVLRTLETQDYINTPVIPNTNPPNPALVKTTKEIKPIVHPNELPNLNDTMNGTTAVRKEQEIKRDKELRKSDSVSNASIFFSKYFFSFFYFI